MAWSTTRRDDSARRRRDSREILIYAQHLAEDHRVRAAPHGHAARADVLATAAEAGRKFPLLVGLRLGDGRGEGLRAFDGLGGRGLRVDGGCTSRGRPARGVVVDSSTRHVELRVEAGRVKVDRHESGARAGAGGAWDVSRPYARGASMSVLLFGGVGDIARVSQSKPPINYTVATIVSPRHAKTSKLARAGELALKKGKILCLLVSYMPLARLLRPVFSSSSALIRKQGRCERVCTASATQRAH